jgi:hypothetical protein
MIRMLGPNGERTDETGEPTLSVPVQERMLGPTSASEDVEAPSPPEGGTRMEDSTVPHPLEKSMQQATTIADEDLPLHSFSSITLFMRRRSAWLCVAGASLAYMAFVPPMLVVVPVMSKAFCLEVTSFQQRPAIAEAELHNPACEGLERIVNLIPDDFYVKATVSNLSSDFSTPTGRVFLACILLSSLALLISEFPFWLPRRWSTRDANNVFDSSEGVLRFVWLVVGTLAAAVVAVIPSPEGAEGYEMLLTAMHNVGAMVGYGVFVFMELAQLHLGENVFRRGFNALRYQLNCCGGGKAPRKPSSERVGGSYKHLRDDNDERDYWPLNWDQWLRGCIMITELITGFTFIGVQGALFFGVRSQFMAYYSVFLETGFALLIYGDLFVMGLHGCVMDVTNVEP